VRARILSPASQPSVENALMESLAYYRSGGPLGYAFATNSLERALLHVQEQPGAIPETDARIVAVLDHVRSNLGSPLSPAVLAPLAALSPSRLAHRFREVVGVSLHTYVEQQRMTAARQLLAFSDQPVSSVARQVGYADPLYFSTLFRRLFDEAPSGYRARMRSGPDETMPDAEQ
jgi:AraC family transcriptional regulator of arabinose operon